MQTAAAAAATAAAAAAAAASSIKGVLTNCFWLLNDSLDEPCIAHDMFKRKA